MIVQCLFSPFLRFSEFHFFLATVKSKRPKKTSYFGQKVSVLFDDGNTYIGIIVRKDTETDMWVTVFEDGEEDQTADPAADRDYTLLDQKLKLCRLKTPSSIHQRNLIYSVTKTNYVSRAVKLYFITLVA